MFGALADPSRRQVIGYLSARGTATATELTGELPMTRQAVAKHLATLADAGLVESERQGRETRFRLTDAGEEVDVVRYATVANEQPGFTYRAFTVGYRRTF